MVAAAALHHGGRVVIVLAAGAIVLALESRVGPDHHLAAVAVVASANGAAVRIHVTV